MYWVKANPDGLKRYKKKQAVYLQTVNGIEIWRSIHGMSRLIRESDGDYYISNADCFTINEAIALAKKYRR